MYDKLLEFGIPGAILLVLVLVIQKWMKLNEQLSQDYKNFINKVQEDSFKREDKLMRHINQQDENMGNIVKTLKDMDQRLDKIEKKI